MFSRRLMLLGCACLTAVVLWPAEAAAQRRRPVFRPQPRTTVAVGIGYYRPFYPFYDPFYPAFGFGWAPYYGYPVYGYPYGYPAYYRPSYSSVRLEMKPKNAQVYVDGYFVGDVDHFDGIFQRLDLPPGEHEIAVYLPGYRTYRQKNLFRPGEGYHYKGVLEPLPAGSPDEAVPKPSPNAPDPYRDRPDYGAPRDPYRPPQDPLPPYPGDRREPRDPGRTRPLPERGESRDFGTLNVRVQPADAVVIIDGERWDSPEGGSRLSVQLTAGSHRVEVRKDGFKTYNATVQIRPGDAQALNVSLSRE